MHLFFLPVLLDVKFINQNFKVLLETINLCCCSWRSFIFWRYWLPTCEKMEFPFISPRWGTQNVQTNKNN